MTRKANLVFVASETLLGAKLLLNPSTYLSPHGVDLEHFARAYDGRAAVPLDVRDTPHPIIGFFGLIERWIDLELVAYLSEQRPEWTFLMIGRVAVSDHEAPKRPNIHYLGTRPYGQLPDYGGVRRRNHSIPTYSTSAEREPDQVADIWQWVSRLFPYTHQRLISMPK